MEPRHIVRIANTDLQGLKAVGYALSKIKGVGITFGIAACRMAGIAPEHKCGELSDAQIQKLDAIIKQPVKHGIPVWMLNRQRDMDTGADLHLTGGDLQFAQENDVKLMKKIKCYKGIRHMLGAPVRGQRTRSNFRKNKGKVMGVRRASVTPAKKEEK